MKQLTHALISWLRPRWFRGKGRLLSTLYRGGDQVEANVFGFKMNLDTRELIQRKIYLGIYEPAETRAVLRYLQPGMTVFDVGANVGYFTALAASRVGPGGRVLAFEPSPTRFEKLQRLISENGISNTRAIQIGLGRSESMASLVFSTKTILNHTPSMVDDGAGERIAVQVRTLDAVIAEFQIPRIDLIKLDVEGFESEVLHGASKSIKSGKVSAILCEFNPAWLSKAGTSSGALYSFLKDSGYVANEAMREFKPDRLQTLLFHRRENASREAST